MNLRAVRLPVLQATLLPRHVVGLLILAGGLAALAGAGWDRGVRVDPRVAAAFAAGSLAAAATALGTLPALVLARISDRVHAGLLGFGAGVMMAASAFSLIVPGIAASRALEHGPASAALQVAAGLLLGAVCLCGVERGLARVPSAAPDVDSHARRLHSAWLFVLAIMLHNVPEGLAIGVAYGGQATSGAQALALGIAVQDIPEGLVVALALRSVGYRRAIAVAIGAASGLMEPVMAALGAALIGFSSSALPWGLGMAAGAMLAVISREVIPDAHGRGHNTLATASLLIGFVLMMVLDTALG